MATMPGLVTLSYEIIDETLFHKGVAFSSDNLEKANNTKYAKKYKWNPTCRDYKVIIVCVNNHC